MPSWEEIYELCIEVSRQVKDSGYRPDVVVAIANGGLVPARIIADFIDQLNILVVKIKFYAGPGQKLEKPELVVPIQVDLHGSKVLIVDDVADTGESLIVAVDHVESKGAGEVRTATLFYKPWSKIKPDFYAKETEEWIIFPWERIETLRMLYDKLKREGQSREDALLALKRIGYKEDLLRWVSGP